MAEFHNIVTYARENLHTFEEEKLGEVDSLIFTTLSYLYFHEEVACNFSKEGMSIRDLLKAEYFPEMFHRIWSPEDVFDLLVAVIASPRYRDIRIRYYRNEIDHKINLQFSAVVFSVTDTLHYVAYRGTDWTITGWKEDLLLALKKPVPAQKMAVNYLNSIGNVLSGELIVGGHSKGGNLAVFASVHCRKNIRDRISAVYSHDGPGFLKSNIQSKGFAEIKDKIHKTIPGASYFGMLFECETAVKIVESNGVSLMQHNPVTWRVENGQFYETEERSHISVNAVKRLNTMIYTLSDEERANFILALFKLFDDLQIKHIDELRKCSLRKVVVAIKKMDKEHRRYLFYILKIFSPGVKMDKNIDLDGLIKDDYDRKTLIDEDELNEFNDEYDLFIAGLN